MITSCLRSRILLQELELTIFVGIPQDELKDHLLKELKPLEGQRLLSHNKEKIISLISMALDNDNLFECYLRNLK